MARVTQCDRCKGITPFLVGDPAGDSLQVPMRVKIPSVVDLDEEDGDGDERVVKDVELCIRCLKGLEAWYGRGVKE